MNIGAALANRLLLVAFRGPARRFHRGSRNLAAVQDALLRRYLEQNRDSRAGQRWGFGAIRSVEDYRARVPLSRWEDYQGDIQALREGETAVLTQEDVTLLEPTSGSSGGSKLIPYTRSLQREYMAGVKPWLADLYQHYPRLLDGPAYWSVSPTMALLQGAFFGGAAPDQSPSQVPLGFQDDAQYFGPLAGLLRGIFPVPGAVKGLADLADFRLATLVFLVMARDLRLISVWNPSFFTILLDFAQDEARALVDSLARGRMLWLGPGPQGRPGADPFRFRPQPERARELARLLEMGDWPTRLWPHLGLISCWTQGQSRGAARELAARFPGVPIQGKGLLATEGIVSIPLVGAGVGLASGGLEDPTGSAAVLAYRSHFFEFLDRGGRFFGAAELEPGMEVEPILTTGGGLYRYQLGDRVRVRGWFRGLPVLDFLGRTGVSDICGEKLAGDFVARVLDRVLARVLGGGQNQGASPLAPTHERLGFSLLAPVQDRGVGRPAYCLFVGGGGPAPRAEKLEQWRRQVEGALRENIHYDYARSLGQLNDLQIQWLAGDPARRWQEFRVSRGMSPGQIKTEALYRGRDIRDCFSRKEN